MRVLIADKFPDQGVQALRNLGCEVTADADLKDETLTAALRQHRSEALVVRSTKVQEPQLEAAKDLALIVRAGAGVNTIDVAGASARGVYVANCPGKNSVAVAELAFAHILSLDRRLVDGASDLKNGVWNKKGYGKARGIMGSTLGLVGLGQIGQEMVSRAKAFGMDVVAWSRSLTPDRAAALGVTFAESPLEVARQSHALSVHVALNPQTKGLIGADVLGALPDGAIVVNTARGGVIDEAALAQAVEQKGLKVGLDVFENEPTSGTGELEPGIFALAGIQGTHHIGASTEQAQNAVAAETVRILETFVKEGTVPNCVNLVHQGAATHLLVVRHRDRIGVLAGVLDALREAGINVQEMENVLFAGGAAACARIQLTAPPSDTVVEKIRSSSDNVLAVAVTSL